MIYPEFFPEERKNELSELKMFEKLKSLSDQYDIFYSKKFVTDGVGKKSEIVTLEEGIETVRVSDMVLESARTGSDIKF